MLYQFIFVYLYKFITLFFKFVLMYYIYHIPNVKIGCTKNPKNRIKQQTNGEYEILETHIDKFIASKRELELQKQYGYPLDTCDYIKSTINFNPLAPSLAGTASQIKQWKENRQASIEKSIKGGKANAKLNGKPVTMCDMNGNQIITFLNRKIAADYVDGNKASLIQVIDKPNNSYKGFKWINPL